MMRLSTLLATLVLILLLSGCTKGGDVRERTDVEILTIPARGGIEYKLFVEEGDTVDYEWSAGRPLFFDFHGDREGDPPEAFTSHESGTLAGDTGTFVAPFTGRHGWYWQNDHASEATLTLRTSGTYGVVGLV